MTGSHIPGSGGVDPRHAETDPYFSGAHPAPPTRAEERARSESLGEMFAHFAEKLSLLMRQEVALAKAEATDSAKKAGKGAGMLAGAALAAFFVLLFLSTALMWALGSLMPLGWAAFIVALLWAAGAAVLAVLGKKELDRIKGLPQTRQTIQEIPETLNPTKETP